MRIAGCPADFGGCGWYRVILPLQTLDGHDVRITPQFGELAAFDPDVILCQRISKPDILEALRELQRRGTRIVLDCDDDLWHLPATNPCASMYGVGKPATRCLEEAIAMADVVTCATNGLAETMRKFRSDIVVIENAVSEAHFNHARPPITGRPKREGEIRIGYAGSPSHKADVETIRKPLKRIMKRFPQVRLVSVGQALPVHQAFTDRAEFDPGIIPQPGQSAVDFMGTYYWLLGAMDLDIAVAPLEPCRFNEGKSHVKLLEYGLAGIPIVASPVGPYLKYYTAGFPVPIWLAQNSEPWETELSAMIHGYGDPIENRRHLADENKRFIRERHTITSRAAAWRSVLT